MKGKNGMLFSEGDCEFWKSFISMDFITILSKLISVRQRVFGARKLILCVKIALVKNIQYYMRKNLFYSSLSKKISCAEWIWSNKVKLFYIGIHYVLKLVGL